MKILNFSFVLIISLMFLSCAKKQPTDAMGNPINSSDINSEKQTANNLVSMGEELFNGKGVCNTCHKPNQKTVGPSIKEIVEAYEKNNASIAQFINGELEPIIDASQFEIMKANFVITKAMTPQEREAIEAYMKQVK